MKRAFVPVLRVPEFLYARAAAVPLRAVSLFCEAVVFCGMAG